MSRSFDECIKLANERDKCKSFKVVDAIEVEAEPYFNEIVRDGDTWICPLCNDLTVSVNFDKEMVPLYYTTAVHYTDGTVALAGCLLADIIDRVISANTYCVDKPINDSTKKITYTIGNFVFCEEIISEAEQKEKNLSEI